MKKIFSAILMLTVISFSAKAQKEFVVDANAEMRTLTGSFTKIKVSGTIDIYLSQAETQSIAISASEDKFKEGIKTVVEGNVLNIYYNGERSWRNNRKIKVYISFKMIDELQASGASDIIVAGTLNVPSLEMHLSGASDFKGDVKTNNLNLHLNGASDVTLTGSTTQLTIESSGASDVKGYGFATDFCNATVSGASDINITINKELTAQASGASNVYYKGDGVIKDMHSSGASSISKRNR
ncbi:MAG: head GIN domain-containing protein [Ferruginibacter sp.]